MFCLNSSGTRFLHFVLLVVAPIRLRSFVGFGDSLVGTTQIACEQEISVGPDVTEYVIVA